MVASMPEIMEVQVWRHQVADCFLRPIPDGLEVVTRRGDTVGTDEQPTVVNHDNTVVMAAHSVGKTRALSQLVLWWVGAFPTPNQLHVERQPARRLSNRLLAHRNPPPPH